MTKHKKKLKILSFSLFGLLPLAISSCSTVSSSGQLIKKSVSVGSGEYLDENISLRELSGISLLSTSGMKAYLDEVANSLILDWFKRASEQSNSFEYKTMYNNQTKSVEDSWKDLVKKYKNEDSSSWSIKVQQNELDPNGGTVESYKNRQMRNWAKEKFLENLFKVDYLTFKDASNNIIKTPTTATVSDLYTALSSQKFLFASSETIANQNLLNINQEYANFVNYIWDKYVQIENPFVVNMSLWKYSTPVEGMSKIYLGVEDSTTTEGSGDSSSTPTSLSSISSREGESGSTDSGGGEESTTTPNSGSYTHPYFSNDATNPSIGTITKFANFVNQAKGTSTSTSSNTIPFKMEFDTSNYGLLHIPVEFTDDSSTYILAKNGTIYNDLYPEFAAASSYLFWRNTSVTKPTFDTTSSASGIPSIDSTIGQKLNTVTIDKDTSTGLDPISKLFISKNPFFNSTNNGGTGTPFNNNTLSLNNPNLYQLKLSSSYVSKLINPTGPLKGIASNELYTIDAFVPTDNNLNNFMLLRNQAGVHAISIDGAYYINNGQTQSTNNSISNSTTSNALEKKKKAGQVVLFRSLLNDIINKPSYMQSYSFDIDLQTELKSFFEKNMSWLIISYALETSSSQKLFDINSVFGGDNTNQKDYATKANSFLHEVDYFNRVYDYNKVLLKQKSTYSANYGVDATKNGFAAPWVYQSFATESSTTSGGGASGSGGAGTTTTTNSADKYNLNPFLSFMVASTVDIVNNPYSTGAKVITTNPDGSTFVSFSELQTSVKALTSSLNVLDSTFEGFKYRQYIYSNSEFINFAILGFSLDGNNLQDISKLAHLKNYISDVFDFQKLSFKDTSSLGTNSNTKFLNNALIDYFYNSTFDASEYKWDRLSSSDNEEWNNLFQSSSATPPAQPSTTTTKKILEILQKYKKQLWTMSVQNISSASISSYLGLFTTVATIKYLSSNNWENFLEYLKTKSIIGNDIYIVWENSQNVGIQKTKETSASNLLSAQTKINRNLNNSYGSHYLGGQYLYNSNGNGSYSAPLTITDNVGDKSIYSPALTSYYTVVSNMFGFKGIQTSSSNSLASPISERLFTNPRRDNMNNTGLLYAYGKDSNHLINIINSSTTLSDVNKIANDLGKKLNEPSILKIANDNKLTINEKKEKLVNVVENINKVSGLENAFTQRKGIVGENETNTNNNNGLINDNSPIEYSAYVIQLNYEDLSSITNLKNAIQSTTNNKPSSFVVQNNAQTTITLNQDEIFYYLVVQQAMNSDIQTKTIESYLSDRKITAYDKRLYKTLGPTWINNWKETN